MTSDRIAELVETAKSDEVQSKLTGGFMTSFVPKMIEKWEKWQYLSEREQEVLEDIVNRLTDKPTKPSTFSRRRYEGFGG